MTELERWKAVVAQRRDMRQPWESHDPVAPLYELPVPLATIQIPNSRFGISGDAARESVTYWSFEARLQINVQSWVGPFSGRNMSDVFVRQMLNYTVEDCEFMRGYDSNLENANALVEIYTQLYRFAVTPI